MTSCSPFPARPGTSARAATRSACCSTANGSRRASSPRWRTDSTCSPSRGSSPPDSIARRRAWLGELCRIAARLLGEAYAEALPGSRPGLILFVQAFGDLVNFHRHVHVLAADGVFRADGTFLCLPPVPEEVLREGFRQAALDFLVKARAIPAELRSRLLEWRHCGGFSVHNRVGVAGDDPEGRQKLAGTMLRAPMSLEKMTYDARSGTVIYRSRMHAGLKRNFQVMPGAQWLELLCRHIRERYEHRVRYCGWYSNRARGDRTKQAAAARGTEARAAPAEPLTEFAARARAAWARLIRKVYEADSSSNARSARGRCGSSP